MDRPKADLRRTSFSTARWRTATALVVGLALLFNSVVGAQHVAARAPSPTDPALRLAADLHVLCSSRTTEPASDRRDERTPVPFCQICQIFGQLALPAPGNALSVPGLIVSPPPIIVHLAELARFHHATPRNRGPPAA